MAFGASIFSQSPENYLRPFLLKLAKQGLTDEFIPMKKVRLFVALSSTTHHLSIHCTPSITFFSFHPHRSDTTSGQTHIYPASMKTAKKPNQKAITFGILTPENAHQLMEPSPPPPTPPRALAETSEQLQAVNGSSAPLNAK